jgi:hypothetical protein
MVLYNFSAVTQANSTLEYMTALTDVVPIFPIGMAVAIMAVLMLSFKSDDIPTLLMISGFFTTSISAMLWLAGYMPFMVIVFLLLLTVVGAIISYFSNS